MRHGGYKAIAIAAVFAAIVWIFVLMAGGFKAEAVIGGIGNVTMSTNPHNLSASSSGIRAVSETQVCIFCHTPHHAITDTSLLNAPLWNHRLSTALYAVTNAPGAGYQLSEPRNPPDGSSKMCLSCHDGTIGIGNLASGAVAMDTDTCLDPDGSLKVGDPSCRAGIGNNLTTHHLVSIPVNQSLINEELALCAIEFSGIDQLTKYPWSTPNPLGDVVLLRPTAQDFKGAAGIAGDDASIPAPANTKYKAGYNYGVQCSSCHDPHLWVSAASSATAGYKFIVASFNSLCNACHCTCDGDPMSPTFGTCMP